MKEVFKVKIISQGFHGEVVTYYKGETTCQITPIIQEAKEFDSYTEALEVIKEIALPETLYSIEKYFVIK